MTDARDLNAEDRDLLAAELALRLLTGTEESEARALEMRDPAFAAAVAAWGDRFAPLFDRIAPVEPDAALWGRIARGLALRGGSSNLASVERRVGWWRGAAIAMTALAAALALALGLGNLTRQPTPLPQPAARQFLIASVAPEGEAAMAVISYETAAASLIVTPAALTPVAGHSHQLWLVPAEGNPHSLGLVTPGDARRIAVPAALIRTFAADATIAISAEQEGGSRTGQPAGPIVATGKLRPV